MKLFSLHRNMLVKSLVLIQCLLGIWGIWLLNNINTSYQKAAEKISMIEELENLEFSLLQLQRMMWLSKDSVQSDSLVHHWNSMFESYLIQRKHSESSNRKSTALTELLDTGDSLFVAINQSLDSIQHSSLWQYPDASHLQSHQKLLFNIFYFKKQVTDEWNLLNSRISQQEQTSYFILLFFGLSILSLVWLSRKNNALNSTIPNISNPESEHRSLRIFPSAKLSHYNARRDFLEKKETEFQTIFNNSPFMFFILDQDGNIKSVNHFASTQLSYSPEELIGQPMGKVIHEKHRQLWQKEMLNCQKNHGILGHQQMLNLCKDGTSFWVDQFIRAFFNSNGEMNLLVFSNDITHQKITEKEFQRTYSQLQQKLLNLSSEIEQTHHHLGKESLKRQRLEAALLNSEERYRLFSQWVCDYFYTFRIDENNHFEIEWLTKSFSQLTGFDNSVLQEKNGWMNVIFPDDIETVKQIFRNFLDNRADRGEFRVFTKNGKICWLWFYGFPVWDEKQQRVVKIYGGAQDITGRKRANAALQESEQRFRQLFENSPDVVIVKDSEDRILDANQAACQLFRYSLDELLQIEFETLLSSPEKDSFLKKIEQRLNGRLPLIEVTTISKTGETIPVEVNVSNIIYKNKPALLLHIRDISERKSMEKKILHYTEKLESMVAERTKKIKVLERQRRETEKLVATGRMAARIAHEINNPLAGIQNSFRLIKDSIPTNHPHHHYVERIDNEINRIANIVRQMFDLYRPDRVSSKRFSILRTVKEVISLMDSYSRERQVKIRIIPIKGNSTVTLPENLVRQVLFNIIQNAIEASPQGGEVVITPKTVKNGILISISDQGCGIKEKYRHKIFEPFFSTKNQFKASGMGLGLSISREIVEALSGTINFETQKNQGTTFHIFLPSVKKAKRGRKNNAA
ncbi:MAG: PAS domain-containing sensor histidine kinase [Calditrichaeota bacterium]|nr:MAG: PAS domain-containing sensor histidine kinase [Calditrichota bacterium]